MKSLSNEGILLREYLSRYYARTGKKMPSSVFTDINQALKQQYNYQIEFYKETEYGTC